jgi:CubicO group peptidase (beta-lactamase class C family)
MTVPFSAGRRRAIARIAAAVALPFGVSPSASYANSLDDTFDRLARAEGYDDAGPGLAVAIQERGKPVFSRCIGLATLHDRRPVTPKTMFELASVSKPITSTAVLILHEQKQLAVSDPVRKYLPELPDYAPDNPIRIRDLLHQVSGLGSYLDLRNVPCRNGDCWVNDDYVGEFTRQNVPLAFPTGAKFQYNNTNYLLLAVIISRVAKTTYGKFLREAIFDPAGMTTAFVSEGPDSVPHVPGRVDALGYGLVGGKWNANWGCPPARLEKILTAGDGAIWCSLEDMAAWDTAIQSGKLLKAETMQLALTPSKTRDGAVNDYGFGWGLDLGSRGVVTGYGHTGGWGGFRTSYHHDLATRRTIITLRNGRGLDSDRFTRGLNEAIKN